MRNLPFRVQVTNVPADSLRSFVHDYLNTNTIFYLRLLQSQAGQVPLVEVLCALWLRWS